MYNSIAVKNNRNCNRAVRKQKRKSLRIAVLLVLSIVTIVVFSVSKTAQAEEAVSLHKYYKTIVIHPEDTLWTIAEEISENGEYKTADYVREIQEINHIGSSIQTGMKLIVPYYAE